MTPQECAELALAHLIINDRESKLGAVIRYEPQPKNMLTVMTDGGSIESWFPAHVRELTKDEATVWWKLSRR